MMRISTLVCVTSLLTVGCGAGFKTSQADLAMKSYDKAPDAPAVILERSGRVVLAYVSDMDDAGTFKAFGRISQGGSGNKVGAASSTPGTGDTNAPNQSMKRDTGDLLRSNRVGSYTLEVGVRIKLLSEAGLSRAAIDDVLPPGATLEDFAAATILPDGRQITIERSAIDTSSGRMRFSLPQAQVGAVLEYHYKFHCRDLSTLNGWTFQEELPVAKSVFRFKMLAGTNLPYRFVTTAEGQKTTPKEKKVLGMNREQWVDLTWRLDHLPAADAPRAAILFGE
jgi:hypothetical protein